VSPSAAENPAPTLGGALPPLGAMFAMQVMMSMAGLAAPVFAVHLAADLGISAGWVGLYMSAMFIVAMFSGVLGGGAVMRLGAVRVAQVCLVVAAAALALMCLGQVIWVVLAALMIGLAYGPPTPASSHILARTTPPRLMPIVFSLKQTGVPAGGALAGALVPFMVLAWGWRGAAIAVGLAALALALLLQPIRARFDADRDRDHRVVRDLAAPLRLVLRDPAMRRLSFLAGSYSAVQMSLIAFLVSFLVEYVGLDIVAAGAVLAVAQVAGIAGRIFWGAISGTLVSARWVLFGLGMVMAVTSLVIAAVSPTTPLVAIYGAAAVFGASAIGWNGVMLAELARIAPPGKAGFVTGGSVFVTFGGVVLAPALFSGLLALGLGYGAGFIMLAGLSVLGAGMALRHSA
jgi:predicted MFS family arabinose efflux permease